MIWTIYLSGEIHTPWREELMEAAERAKLPVEFLGPITDHSASDAAGDMLGKDEKPFWRDHQSAKVNSIRTRTMLDNCDLAIIRFGDKFKQWNAAYDAGYCAALGKPYITFHKDDLIHALKEVNSASLARAQSVKQIIEILKYIASDQS